MAWSQRAQPRAPPLVPLSSSSSPLFPLSKAETVARSARLLPPHHRADQLPALCPARCIPPRHGSARSTDPRSNSMISCVSLRAIAHIAGIIQQSFDQHAPVPKRRSPFPLCRFGFLPPLDALPAGAHARLLRDPQSDALAPAAPGAWPLVAPIACASTRSKCPSMQS
jgi:hypothetical protein